MNVKIQQGWSAPSFKEQLPCLPAERADFLDRVNRCVTELYIAGFLTDAQVTAIREKKFPKLVAAELKAATLQQMRNKP